MKLSASILNAMSRVDSVLELNKTNVNYVHIDVMDGKFVSDSQFKINEIKAINMVSKYPMDIHLMVNDPIKYILELKDMNIEYITFHLEIRRSKEKIIAKIRETGYKVGIAVKPDTDLNKLKPYLKDIDMILVLSVEPGKGGQKFIDGSIDRINEVKKMIDDSGCDIKIEVDGGINDTTITELKNVDIAVVGSYIINSDSYYISVNKLLKSASNNKVNENSNIYRQILLYNCLLGLGILSYFFMLSYVFVNKITFNDLCNIGLEFVFTVVFLVVFMFIFSILKLKKLSK